MSLYEKKGWYRLSVPEGWEVDDDESPVAIYHPDGAGALQVTAESPRPLPPGGKIDVFLMLRAFLKQTGVDFDETLAARSSAGGLDRAFYEYSADSPEVGRILWRSWMVTNHDIVVFLTYACREEEQERERGIVDGIVASLSLR
ncbi:MAG TPA: hypothetical protein VMU54_21725 [Planctomycetota bacterium]|nr:hypothetical protein [Planctomycetota bacterium]